MGDYQRPKTGGARMIRHANFTAKELAKHIQVLAQRPARVLRAPE